MVDLGFGGPGGFFTDSAYNLGADPVFSNIPHTGSSLTLEFIIEGVGVQDINDESWAMDNLRVSVVVPEPSTWALCSLGLLIVCGCAWRKQARRKTGA